MAGVFLIGCNPYSSDFTCPKTDNGQCVSVADAYNEALRPNAHDMNNGDGQPQPGQTAGQNDDSWQRAMQNKFTSLLREPNTPLVAQPSVMRVLMLPYKGDQNELYMMRFVYLFIDEPRWVMGDYLINNKNNKMNGVH